MKLYKDPEKLEKYLDKEKYKKIDKEALRKSIAEKEKRFIEK